MSIHESPKLRIVHPPMDSMTNPRVVHGMEHGPVCKRQCQVSAFQVAQCLKLRLSRLMEFEGEDPKIIPIKDKIGECAAETLLKAKKLRKGEVPCNICEGQAAKILQCLALARSLQTDKPIGVSNEEVYVQEELGRAMSKCATARKDQMLEVDGEPSEKKAPTMM
jgi:hypothetical protein